VLHLRAIAAALLSALVGAPILQSQSSDASAELTGRITFIPPPGQKAGPGGTLVWLPGVVAQAPAAAAPSITSSNKRFEPHVLAVPRGTQVAFPNVDSIYHNAFSRTPGSEFDLGLYRRGAARAFTFRSAGLVRLYCNIHAEMAAYVLVLDPEDAFTVAAADGSFRLADLPAGRQAVHVWSEKGGEKELTVDVGAEGAVPLEVVLDASTYRPMPHKNKFGKDYPPATQGVDRY